MRIFKLFFCLVLYSLTVFGQSSDKFPQIFHNDLNNVEVVTSKYYKGESLWGLINGGADVYLEYGFDKLLFQEVKWKNKSFHVEIYKMKSPESAFGIYSISKYKCSSSNTDDRFICITPYQVQGCIGNYYISIANEVGDSISQEATLKIYEVIDNQIPKVEIQIPTKIKSNVNLNNYSKLKFIAGSLGLQNGYPNWSDLFENIEHFSFFLNEVTIDNEPIILAEIRFENKDEVETFLNNAKNYKDSFRIEKLSNGSVFIIDGKISKKGLKNLIQ